MNLNSDRMAEIGASLKKNSISIDIIAFGEASSDESQTTLKVLIDTANSSDNCHMVMNLYLSGSTKKKKQIIILCPFFVSPVAGFPELRV